MKVIVKIIVGIVIATALWALVMSILQGVGDCLDRSPWVGWVLSIALYAGIIWLNSENKNS